MTVRWFALMPSVLLTGGCALNESGARIGLLVLVPFLLILAVFWWLNRRSGEEDDWEKDHFPDQDDDDNEDHFLM